MSFVMRTAAPLNCTLPCVMLCCALPGSAAASSNRGAVHTAGDCGTASHHGGKGCCC